MPLPGPGADLIAHAGPSIPVREPLAHDSRPLPRASRLSRISSGGLPGRLPNSVGSGNAFAALHDKRHSEYASQRGAALRITERRDADHHLLVPGTRLVTI